MTREEIISGLQMTMDLFLFDPATGETTVPDMLNDIDRETYDACKGAIEALKAQDVTDTNVGNDDLISRQMAIRVASGYCHPANIAKELAKLPAAEPEPQWILCSERLPEEETEVLVTRKFLGCNDGSH